jgi:hypothetical protein
VIAGAAFNSSNSVDNVVWPIVFLVGILMVIFEVTIAVRALVRSRQSRVR